MEIKHIIVLFSEGENYIYLYITIFVRISNISNSFIYSQNIFVDFEENMFHA